MTYNRYTDLSPLYDYIWIALNEASGAFRVSVRNSKIPYTSEMYWVGGIDLGTGSTLDNALTIAQGCVDQCTEGRFPFGIRVSEEAALQQGIYDKQDAALNKSNEMDKEIDAIIEDQMTYNSMGSFDHSAYPWGL